jgi:hypothetical protein
MVTVAAPTRPLSACDPSVQHMQTLIPSSAYFSLAQYGTALIGVDCVVLYDCPHD